MATQNNDAKAVKFHEIFDKQSHTFNNYNQNIDCETIKQTPSNCFNDQANYTAHRN